MKILYNWLREFVPLEISPAETATVLARLGIEVSSVQILGGPLKGVVTAVVKDVQKHPNADRLFVCTVYDGTQDFSVVCGAPNVAAGQHVPLARVGAVLPDGHTLEAANLRGVESQGMICSAAELGLEDKSEGIMVLNADTPPGQDVRSLLGLDDAILEIEITPNRRDVLSVFGVARELAAALNLSLKRPEPRVRELDLNSSIAVSNEASDSCPRYIARYARDIRVGPSPAWMVRRLERCGLRSINNIVDVTNYVMIELGQPLHAFDAAKLRGHRLRIRPATRAEEMVTLDGKKIELHETMLIIADEERPVALAGIMGGVDSGISLQTSEIILESASFAPGNIRFTSKSLGISTDSSYRFERGTDWNMVAFASLRAAQLLEETAGGMGYKAIEATPRPYSASTIKLRTDRVRKVLGIDLKPSTMADILRRLGCTITTGTEQHLVTVPTWRLDLTMEADLMEEIARVYGYDQIPSRVPPTRATTVPDDHAWSFQRRLAEVLVGLGLFEAYNYSFLSSSELSEFVPGLGQPLESHAITLANPLSQELAVLRTSLIPGLLKNALTNFHRQIPGVSLFELGRIFAQDKGGCQESSRLGILLGGTVRQAHWRQKPKKADYFEIAGLVERLLAALHITVQSVACDSTIFHPKRSATLLRGTTVIGWMGEIHPVILEKLDTREPLVSAEFDLEALKEAASVPVTYKSLSIFPPVRRDLSFVVDETVPYEKVHKVVRAAGGTLLEQIQLIDLFRGPSIGGGKKSMTLTLVFRHSGRTLTDAEIEKTLSKMQAELLDKCGAAMRQ